MNDNYRTLHKDIGLIQRSNNGWDLWFDNGDTVKATEFHSLQVGIIIACLTSWNYMNRYGNPTYEIFGNRAYELLKANKSSMVAYKIQQYFIECLKRMRRVYEIVYLEVTDVPNDPHKYYVEFEVISISNQLVNGSFTVSTDNTKSTSFIEYNIYTPYASNSNPLIIDLWLKNEYGGGLEGEILYMYLKKDNGNYQFIKAIGKTDEQGYIRVEYTPNSSNENNTLYFDFQGNTTYNPSTSKRTSFKTELFSYSLEFLNDSDETRQEENILILRLLETSDLTHNSIPKPMTQIVIVDEYGGTYYGETDENGETNIRVNVDKDTKFTAKYGDVETDLTLRVIKETPTITLTVDDNYKSIGESLELTTTLLDSDNNPLPNFEIIIKDNDDIIGTVQTNLNGVANFTVECMDVGEHTYSVTTKELPFYNSVTDNELVVISKQSPIISLEASSNICGKTTINATITTNILDGEIILKDNNETIATIPITDENITYTTLLESGEHTITAILNGTSLSNYHSTSTDITIDEEGMFAERIVNIEWDDDNNSSEVRPNRVVLRVYADNDEVNTHILTPSYNYSATFNELPLCNDGELVTYSFSIDEFDNYILTNISTNDNAITYTYTKI